MDAAVRTADVIETRMKPGTVPRQSLARAVLDNPDDCALAAGALAGGQVIGHGFANFYVITARPDRDSVRRVNLMKGRPADQVGSITVPPSGISDLFDWSKLPAGLTRRSVLNVIDTFYGIGPFGFRGPAAGHVPEHLTFTEDAVVTAQVIAPGYACPSNDFLSRCLGATGEDLLYITSANRSRHLTGADDTPAHWRASGLRRDFGHETDFTVLEHPDEDVARAAYPRFLPMSTTILSFHRLGTDAGDPRPQLVLDRHGSFPLQDVRAILDRLGFGLTLGPKAGTRLLLRDYGDQR
jgi:hypothetical protein